MGVILTINSKIGDWVSWNTISGDHYEGRLIEWDSNVAIVELANGREKAVEC